MIFSPMVPPLVLGALCLAAILLAAVRVLSVRTLSSGILWGLRVLTVVALSAILLRPSIPAPQVPTDASNVDLYFVVDTTSSIVAEDWADGAPRLDGVRADLAALVEQFSGGRFALITFDGIAATEVPLTSDAQAVLTAASHLRPEIVEYSRGSSIGAAAVMLEEQLRSAALQDPARARAVVYFGDGEQTAPTPPESFAASAIHISGGAVFGYGTEQGATMLENDGRHSDPAAYIVDPATGAPAVSRIDTARLQSIAEQLDLRFEHRRSDSPVPHPLVAQTVFSADGSLQRAGNEELYWVPAIVLMGLLCVQLGSVVTALASSFRAGRRR